MRSLVVHDESPTGRVLDSLTLPPLPDRVTVRELVRTRVREEVAAYNARPTHRFRGLVQPSDTEATVNGYRLRTPRRLDWEKQADVAEQAFARNGFVVLVGDRQVESLDEEVELGDDPHVAFVRLVPLVGG